MPARALLWVLLIPVQHQLGKGGERAKAGGVQIAVPLFPCWTALPLRGCIKAWHAGEQRDVASVPRKPPAGPPSPPGQHCCNLPEALHLVARVPSKHMVDEGRLPAAQVELCLAARLQQLQRQQEK